MHNVIINHISSVAKLMNINMFLFGTYAKYTVTQDQKYLLDNTIDFFTQDTFDIKEFYKLIGDKITINKELSVSNDLYSVQSGDYVLRFNFKKPTHILTIDDIYSNIITKENSGSGISDLYNENINLLHDNPSVYELFYLSINSSWFNNVNISNAYQINTPVNIDTNLFYRLFTCYRPGIALSILSRFINRTTLFSNLINVLSENNLFLDEDVSYQESFTPQRLSLIDSYNEFILSHSSNPEPLKTKLKRFRTGIKLLFDISGDDEKLFISNPSFELFAATGGNSDTPGGITTPEEIPKVPISETTDSPPTNPVTPVTPEPPPVEPITPEPPPTEPINPDPEPTPVPVPVDPLPDLPIDCHYGRCPECHPNLCNPKCCCCYTIDIVSATRFKCHKRIILSCNHDATAYGLSPDETFPSTCTDCQKACQTVLGLREDLEGEGCDNLVSIGSNEGWWTLPYGYFPCECSCKVPGANGCDLTCVTCRNKYCRSNLNITASNCNYQMSLTPGSNCCGPGAIDWIFIVDTRLIGNPSILTRLINITNDIGSRVPDAQIGLVIYDGNLADLPGGDHVVPHIPLTDITTFQTKLTTYDYLVYGSNVTFAFQEMENTQDGSGNPINFGLLPTMLNKLWGFDYRGVDTYVMQLIDESPSPSVNLPDDTTDMNNEIQQYLYSLGIDSGSYFNIIVTLPANLGPLPQINSPYHYWVNSFDPCAYSSTDSHAYLCWEYVVQRLNLRFLPGSCACLDRTPLFVRRNTAECQCCKPGTGIFVPPFAGIPGHNVPCVDDPTNTDCIQSLPNHCFDIPIKKCTQDDVDGGTCNCNLPFGLLSCGSIITVAPHISNLVCCSALGHSGCDCPSDVDEQHPVECCGPQCHDICTMFRTNQNIQDIVDFVWLDCWTKRFGIDEAATPHCTDSCCPDPSNVNSPNYPCELREAGSDLPCCPCTMEHMNDCCHCCIKFTDENGNPTITYCKDDIESEVRNAISVCTSDGSTIPPIGPTNPPDDGTNSSGGTPPPSWNPPNAECTEDKCIVGEPDLSEGNTLQDQCDNIGGCTSLRHPSVCVLNNGIGLVAYESFDSNSTIKIQQFKTSVKNKLFSNREFNYGRLEHSSKWSDTPNGFKLIKLYIYEDVSDLISGVQVADLTDISSWKDAISFANGPLQKQFFPVASPEIGEDEIGRYVSFIAPKEFDLTHPFYSSDDAYNIRWFVFDASDSGLIGDSVNENTQFDTNHTRIDKTLLLEPHVYNGYQVPVAYPSICSAKNYSDANENAQFVFLTYQALEDSKWNIYLRQIRLSEYDRQDQIDDAILNNNIVPLSDLSIDNLVYRIQCIDDICTATDDKFNLKRTVVFQVLLSDGREVLNPSLTGNWNSLCRGKPSSDFPKSKVFVQFSQFASCDQCPDQLTVNSIFHNWSVGQEFSVPHRKIYANDLFDIIKGSGIDVGDFAPDTSFGISIYSSTISSVWYQDINETVWSTISGSGYENLLLYKGSEVSEPILISQNESGHCTHPVIKTNYKNDLFIAYESTETGIHQIRLVGTAAPNNSLPLGMIHGKNLDSSLDFIFHPNSFVYSKDVTLTGINQLPDMFIDMNDVVHLCWQSNRDKDWEIYYANSENDFSNKRITQNVGKSLKPSIDGDRNGRLYITWHDNRFGNYEIMLAYLNGSRILPLYQQDPYLASVRNIGYVHYIDDIDFSLINETSFTTCLKNIIVDFYEDRALGKLVTSIDQNKWPFAFTIEGAQNDTVTKEYTDFSDWVSAGSSPNATLTSPEFDSGLDGSFILKLSISFALTTGGDTISIAFRASDIENDPLAGAQWTSYSNLTSSGDYYYVNLGLSQVRGRYKQVRFIFSYASSRATINDLSIISEATNRVCIPPNSYVPCTLNLAPDIREDALGENLTTFSITEQLGRNYTYFVKIRAIDENNNEIEMPDPHISASCTSCSNQTSTPNLETCSLTTIIENTDTESKYYNLALFFYYDLERHRSITSFEATFGSEHLKYFTVNNKQSAESKWTTQGLLVAPNETVEVTLWPSLSPSAGLLCGVPYYVSTEICNINASSSSNCTEFDLISTKKWMCNCQSPRWDGIFEDFPVNIRNNVNWISSANGYSDTRITNTDSDNLNSKIKIRSDLSGLIVYETNRKEQESDPDSSFKIYASAFSIVPSYNMHATGAQSIVSNFENLISKNDMPVCKNGSIIGCYDNNGIKVNDTIVGRNLAIDIDQYDNMFLTLESPFTNDSGIQCNLLNRNQQTHLIVHTCSADPTEIFDTGSTTGSPSTCTSKQILNKHIQDNLSPKIIRKIRVKPEFIQYESTVNGVACPVVSVCKIGFIIVGLPETVAIRIRNTGGNWADWIPMSNTVGENTIETDWTLTSGNGLKSVEFECATYAGLSNKTSILIVADYEKTKYQINLYKPLKDTPFPPLPFDLTPSGIWIEENKLNEFEGSPVAVIRQPTALASDEMIVGGIVVNDSDYIFVEIIPDYGYMQQFSTIDESVKSAGTSGIEPNIDIVQQGQSLFNIATTWARNSKGEEVFRTAFSINKDNTIFKDGFAKIIVHLKNDCWDIATTSGNFAGSYNKDQYNVMSGLSNTIVEQSDELEKFRGNLGTIDTAITIRPSDDPYFIFGDPKYWNG